MQLSRLAVFAVFCLAFSSTGATDYRQADYGLIRISTAKNGDAVAELAGQMTHVVRLNPDGTQSCSVEGSDPKLAVLRAAGLRDDGTSGVALSSGKVPAQIQIINLDSSGEGLNDTTPATSVGGNPGVTLGQQRLNAIFYAADIWHRALQSSVPIRVGVNFDPLPCNILGGASATDGRKFAVAPSARAVVGHWYNISNAEALAGAALNAPDAADITMQFNSDFGTVACPGTPAMYLGFAPSPGAQALVPTAVHELAHGLGFSTTTCIDPGGCGGGRVAGDYLGGFPGIFDFWAYDVALAKYWDGMSSIERALSSRDDPFLVWDGPFVKALVPTYLPSGQGVTSGRVRLFAPSTVSAGSSVAHFHEDASPNLMMEPFSDSDVFNETDFTPAFMFDIGWELRFRYRLNLTVVGQGGVGSTPAGIFCPNDCTELYGDSSMVTLSVGAFPGWQFDGWSGACTGASATCQIAMSETRNVTATFLLSASARIFYNGFEL